MCWTRRRTWDKFTLEAPLEHVARTRTVTERVRHLDVCSSVLRRIQSATLYGETDSVDVESVGLEVTSQGVV